MRRTFCLRTGQDNEHVQGLCTSVFYAKRYVKRMCTENTDSVIRKVMVI